MLLIVAQHEVNKLFKSGRIWKLLALCQFILGIIFYSLTEEYLAKMQNQLLDNSRSFGLTEEVIHPFFGWATLLFLLITPLISINCLTEERKSNTLCLYLTASISSLHIILGKFIGSLFSLVILLSPVFFMPLLFSLHDHIDVGQFLCGFFGLLMLLATTLSIGLFVSSFSKDPLTATLVIILTLTLLSLLEWISHFLGISFSWLRELALLYHCKNFLSGVINTQDILYYVTFSVFFVLLSISRLANESTYGERSET